MKKLMTLTMGIAVAMMMAGCVTSYGTIGAPLTLDQTYTDTNFIDNAVRPVKKGSATVTGIVLFTSESASIMTAMKNGGITKIHHVDYRVKNIFNLFVEKTVIVWGE